MFLFLLLNLRSDNLKLELLKNDKSFDQNIFDSQFYLNVERLYGTQDDITIEYQIEPLTAEAGVHYYSSSSHGEIEMKMGEKMASIQIQLRPNVTPRLQKTFRVVLLSTQQKENTFKGGEKIL